MDGTYLTITTAVVGLLAVGGHAVDILWDLNTAPKDLTAPINQALHGVRECRSSIHVLYKTLLSLQAGQLPFPERGTWIQVDELLATLTDTVLAFSKLHDLCELLEYEAATSSPEEACNRHTKRIRALSARIRFHNLSMTMMMTILKCRGQSDAKRSRAELAHRISRLLTSTNLAARLRGEVFSGHNSVKSPSVTIIQNCAASQISDSGSSGLGISPAGSEVGLTHRRWSTLTGLVLVDIPILPALCLPISLRELSDSTQFYAFAFSPQLVGREMAETVIIPTMEARISRSSILGLSGDSWQTEGMANMTRQVNSRAT